MAAQHFVLYFFVALWSITVILKLLLEFILHPISFFKRTKRVNPPDCMLDPTLGKHQYVEANGIKFHYVTGGDPSKPLMLFIHGFPEFWFSWRHQLKVFSEDYHVVAMDLRGYNETERPPKKQDYAITTLCQDVVELIPALGHDKAILVAHDWGGAIAWAVTQRHPELIEKLVVLNCPHGKVFSKTLKSWSQFMKSWYMFFFQVPCLPEFALSVRDYNFISEAFGGGGGPQKRAFPPDVIEAYKYVFSQPGALTGPINYYRCIFSNIPKQKNKVSINTPTLIIWGDGDSVLEASMADAHGDFVTDLTVKHIPGCSHWVQQEEPEKVNEYIREFL